MLLKFEPAADGGKMNGNSKYMWRNVNTKLVYNPLIKYVCTNLNINSIIYTIKHLYLNLLLEPSRGSFLNFCQL